MIVVAEMDGFSVTDAEDFNGFHIDAGGVSQSRFAALLAQCHEVSAHDRPDHAWVRIAFLHEQLGTSRDHARREGLARMLSYAASKGWLNDLETHVAAHVVNISH
ncbi:hypothetical protein [Nocardia sp. R6R-6]|uniref:hypothetical protein n=1 Tax=Nocardia sp. R6R-6 TaxID=3459303 RepID=UPI00403D5E85